MNRGHEKLAEATRRPLLEDEWERLAAADWERVERLTREAQRTEAPAPAPPQTPLTPEERRARKREQKRAWEARNPERVRQYKRQAWQRRKTARTDTGGTE